MTAPVPTLLTGSQNGSNLTTYTTASVSASTGDMIMVFTQFIGNARTVTVRDTANVVGNFNVAAEDWWNSGADEMGCHYKILSGAFSGTLDIIGSGGGNQCHWSVIKIDAGTFDPTTPFPQWNSDFNTTGGSFSANLASPVSSDSRTFCMAGHTVFEGTAEGPNMTQLSDSPGNSGGSPLGRGFEAAWRSDAFETLPILQGTSSSWGFLCIELAGNTGGGGTTVTGFSTVAATAAVGSVTVEQDPAPQTVQAVAAVGSPVISTARTASVSTVSATASVGTLSIVKSAAPSTVTAVAAVGTVTINKTAVVSTVQAIATVNAPTIVVRTVVSTVQAVASVGSPVVRLAAVVSPVAAVAAVGAPIVSLRALVATVAAVAAVGAPSVLTGSDQTAAPATVAAVAQVGAPQISTSITVTVSTVTATAQVGSVTVSTSRTVAVSTVTAIAQVGTVTIRTSRIAAVLTVEAIASVGSPTIGGVGTTIGPQTLQAIAAVGVVNIVVPGVILFVTSALLTHLVLSELRSHQVTTELLKTSALGELHGN